MYLVRNDKFGSGCRDGKAFIANGGEGLDSDVYNQHCLKAAWAKASLEAAIELGLFNKN